MIVLDYTHLTAGYPKRKPRDISKQVHHRSHMGLDTPEELVEAFKDRSLGTGGKYPYHFYVLRDGSIWQLVRLDEQAPGARGHNRNGIQVAWEGDMRRDVPTTAQWEAGLDLARELYLRFDAPAFGHTELPNASRDPAKVCPGANLDMDAIRHYISKGIV